MNVYLAFEYSAATPSVAVAVPAFTLIRKNPLSGKSGKREMIYEL